MVTSNSKEQAKVRQEIDNLYIAGDKKIKEAFTYFRQAKALSTSLQLTWGRKLSDNIYVAIRRAKDRVAHRNKYAAGRKRWQVSKQHNREN